MCGSRASVPVNNGKKNNVEVETNKVMEYSEGVKFFEIHIQTFVTGGLAILVIIVLIGLIGLIWKCWWHRLTTLCGGRNQGISGQGREYVARYGNGIEEREARGSRFEEQPQQSSSELPMPPRGSPIAERRNSRI